MLVALCAVGNWTFEQIVDTYDIPRMPNASAASHASTGSRIIELQPGNRIRPLIGRTLLVASRRADPALFPFAGRGGIPVEQVRSPRRAVPVRQRNAVARRAWRN